MTPLTNWRVLFAKHYSGPEYQHSGFDVPAALTALVDVESHGDEMAVGDGDTSFGALQVHQPAWPRLQWPSPTNPEDYVVWVRPVVDSALDSVSSISEMLRSRLLFYDKRDNVKLLNAVWNRGGSAVARWAAQAQASDPVSLDNTAGWVTRQRKYLETYNRFEVPHGFIIDAKREAEEALAAAAEKYGEGIGAGAVAAISAELLLLAAVVWIARRRVGK